MDVAAQNWLADRGVRCHVYPWNTLSTCRVPQQRCDTTAVMDSSAERAREGGWMVGEKKMPVVKQDAFFLCRGFGREASVAAQWAEKGLWQALEGW